MRIFLYTLSLFLLSSCASAPIHLYGTEKIDTKNLAVVAGQGNEVKILEVDDKPFSDATEQFVYLTPGIHKFLVQLNWDDMIMVGSSALVINRSSQYVRIGCFNLEAAKKYIFGASDSSPNWKFVWVKGGFNKVEVPSCKTE